MSRRSASSFSSISGSRFLAAAMPTDGLAATSFQALAVARRKPVTTSGFAASAGETMMPLPYTSIL
ncbi:hypothetical protein D3C87_2043240 [compost metagenome]